MTATNPRINYLLVIHIPFAREPDGTAITGDMWVRDLRGMAAHLGLITVAAPQIPLERFTAQAAGSFAAGRVPPDDPEIRFLPLPSYGSLKGMLRHGVETIRRLRRYIRDARVVHIDSGGWPIPQGEIAYYLSRRARKPMLLFLGDGGDPVSAFHEKLGRDRTWRSRLGTRALLWQFERFGRGAAQRAELVFFHNPVTAARFAPFARRSASFLRTFVDQSMLLTEAELQAKCDAVGAGPLRCLMAGRLLAMKGVDQAIEAVRRARAEGCDVQLTVVGSGPEEAALRQITTNLGLDEVVTFAGAVEYGKPMFNIFRAHHALIICNLTDELARNVLLGMAHGAALVTYENPATRTVVRHGENALVCPRGDVAALTALLVRLSSDRELCRTLIRNGVRSASEHTFEACHARRAQLTREVLGA